MTFDILRCLNDLSVSCCHPMEVNVLVQVHLVFKFFGRGLSFHQRFGFRASIAPFVVTYPK